MIEYIPGVVLLAVFAIGGAWQRGNEKRAWHNGVCAESGRPWTCFDMDSQGGRGYSDGAGHTTWISYAVDRTANISTREIEKDEGNQ
jgi:hypothetical protein